MDEKKIARAEHKYARISPRKVEIVCNMIRGKDAKVAMAMMQNTPKASLSVVMSVVGRLSISCAILLAAVRFFMRSSSFR